MSSRNQRCSAAGIHTCRQGTLKKQHTTASQRTVGQPALCNFKAAWRKRLTCSGLAQHSSLWGRLVVMMRILLQPFTFFGCHGYTARGARFLETPLKGSKGIKGCWKAQSFVRLPWWWSDTDHCAEAPSGLGRVSKLGQIWAHYWWSWEAKLNAVWLVYLVIQKWENLVIKYFNQVTNKTGLVTKIIK